VSRRRFRACEMAHEFARQQHRAEHRVMPAAPPLADQMAVSSADTNATPIRTRLSRAGEARAHFLPPHASRMSETLLALRSDESHEIAPRV